MACSAQLTALPVPAEGMLETHTPSWVAWQGAGRQGGTPAGGQAAEQGGRQEGRGAGVGGAVCGLRAGQGAALRCPPLLTCSISQQGNQQVWPCALTAATSTASTPTPYWMMSLSRSALRSSCAGTWRGRRRSVGAVPCCSTCKATKLRRVVPRRQRPTSASSADMSGTATSAVRMRCASSARSHCSTCRQEVRPAAAVS